MVTNLRRLGLLLVFSMLPCLLLQGQESRITSPIDRTQTVVLRGHVRPEARLEFDQGAVEASFPLPAITLHFKTSANQQSALDDLLAQQQDPSSPNFHRWLTPEEYADRFGISHSDVDKIRAWLESEGFTIEDVARSRGWIAFSGTTAQVQQAFHTEIHQYNVGGKIHYANATAPSIPAELAGIVTGFRGLSNFHLKPRLVRSKLNPESVQGFGNYFLAPSDFATIYDVAPLYQAGIDGTGQSVAIVGQTAIKIADIDSFRSKFQLPTINLQQKLVPGHTDPGISDGDLSEADLDIEWSSAIARNATIIFVYSDDVLSSLEYAIDSNLAPVVSMSYGSCEASDLIDLPAMRAAAQQGNAQGITWLAASGDTGAADCDDPSAGEAQNGLAIDAPGAIPEVTSMGGTQFNDDGGTYWSTTGAAQSYIPESAWNDTAFEGSLSASGGGTSIYFAQPSWQTGPGVPKDGWRHVPDLSVNASPAHDPYYVYTDGRSDYFGGTSVAAPAMAGIVALLNQYLVSSGAQKQAGVGNINPTLYRIAASKSGVFHDVTTGDNRVPCAAGSPGCTSSEIGYAAGPGYDQTTGVGSPDVYNLVHAWASDPPASSAVVSSVDSNPVFESAAADPNGHRWVFTITLAEEAGVATTLTGFTINGTATDIMTTFGSTSLPANGRLASTGLGFATLSVPTNVVFGFTGVDASGHQWSAQLTVPFEAAQVQLTIGGASNAASGKQIYAPGEIVSFYGTSFGDFAQAAVAIPLPLYMAGFEALVNHVSAPLYYVSPNQVNLQIPYETQPGSVQVTLGNPYVNMNYTIQVSDVAPGIFASNGFAAAPFSSAGRGQVSTLFITGEGQTNPPLQTGNTPNPSTPLDQLPKPVAPVSVTVAGQPATVQFIGIPSGLVGVTQINYQIPSNIPLGVQPVVVTVGMVAGAPVNITITQ